MNDQETVNPDAEIPAGDPADAHGYQDLVRDEGETQSYPEGEVGMVKGTAADKLMVTLRELSKPSPDAGEMELMLATLAMAVENSVGRELPAYQDRGEVDEFLLALCRFLAVHRSDDVNELLVVELPRRNKHAAHPLPAGKLLQALDDAATASQTAESPLW